MISSFIRGCGTGLLLAPVLIAASQAPPPVTGDGPRGATGSAREIAPEEVAAIVKRFGGDAPEALGGLLVRARDVAWPAWVSDQRARTRERLAAADMDSLVNFWLFGTSFTTLPPARSADVSASGAGLSVAAVLERRLDDLLEYLSSESRDPRAVFAREVLQARNLDPGSVSHRERARALLLDARRRVLAENRAMERTLAGARARGGAAAEARAHATIFEDRGLSSDTSILPAFAIDRALDALGRSGALQPGGVGRVAILGPGLDIINKSAGYDFYPPQAIQPFAVIDSLLRLGLSSADVLQVTTFDVNERVTAHLQQAVTGARSGGAYRVHLPLSSSELWTADLLRYWEGWGADVGTPIIGAVPPLQARARVRAVSVRPSAVATVRPVDLDIVLERLELPPAERFDLVVATNVLVYYDAFEQALALENVSAMLRPGGSLLSNNPLAPGNSMEREVGELEVVYSDRQFDRMFWYRQGRRSD
jgi:SAM-dependent methyltransferase